MQIHFRRSARARLQRRGRVCVYRRRVPADLVGLLGRREIVRTLPVESVKAARRLAVLFDGRVWLLFDRLRALSSARGTVASEDVERLIAELCDGYLHGLIAEDRVNRRGFEIAPEDAIGAAIDFEAERFEEKDHDHVRTDAIALLAGAGRELSADDLDALLFELARTRLVALRKIAGEREADARGEPREPLRAPLGAPASAPTAAPAAPSLPLSEVISRYTEDKRNDWAPRTAQAEKAVLAEFLEIVGDRPVRELSKDDIRRYRLTLDKLPAVRSGVRMSLAKALAITEGPRLSASTLRKRVSSVIGLLRYAVRMEYTERNVADGMRPPKPRRADGEREAFTDDDLRRIFGPDYRKATFGEGEHARFWIPLVLLFTGARLEEIAQLEVSDVVNIDGIDCIKITSKSAAEGAAKRLKTVGSERTVPLHSDLIALGFLDYVALRRSRGDRRVFPRLYRTADKGYGVEVSKWFTGWRRRHGIPGRSKVLHSTRHTFTTRLKAADVQEFTIAELLGHVNDNMTTGRYGKKLDVHRLREAVEKLDVRAGLANL